jgi:hypothetical protein
MGIELFGVTYRPALKEPPITLLCQAVNVGGEKFIWLDGIHPDDPVMVSITSVKNIEWAGTFKEFMSTRLDLAERVVGESLGAHSPTLMARAMLYMSRDMALTAADALSLAEDQALDIVDADNTCFMHSGWPGIILS